MPIGQRGEQPHTTITSILLFQLMILYIKLTKSQSFDEDTMLNEILDYWNTLKEQESKEDSNADSSRSELSKRYLSDFIKDKLLFCKSKMSKLFCFCNMRRNVKILQIPF
jgi:hypothetical protein